MARGKNGRDIRAQPAIGALDKDYNENIRALLEAKDKVTGPLDEACAPIVSAIVTNDVGMVDFLLEEGADPDRPVTKATPFTNSKIATTIPGERALHIAARCGNVEIVRLLLERHHADPNATDNIGYTALMATCESQHVCLEVVRLLLEAGADPALAEEGGFIPLHIVALNEDMDLVDMLYTSAPATLNRCTSTDGATPLFMACGEGNARMVSKLLSLGAMQPMTLGAIDICPLLIAVTQGFVDVVRVLINEGGMRVIRGEVALAKALHRAAEVRPPGVLRLLLRVDGEERRSEWANTYYHGSHVLHIGAGCCNLAAVSVLLEAGADEMARDREGCTPQDVIGLGASRDGKSQIDREKEVAIRRALQRGPAYRARSWAWPSDEEADTGGSGDGDTVAAAAAAVLLSPPAMKTPPVIGLRIFRPKEKSSRKFFVRLIGRYCAKE